MSDWSIMMINTAAEMKGKTAEEITQTTMKELGMRQSVIKARLKDRPAHTHKNVLVSILAQARHQAAKRADLIRDRRQTS